MNRRLVRAMEMLDRKRLPIYGRSIPAQMWHHADSLKYLMRSLEFLNEDTLGRWEDDGGAVRR